MLTTKSDTGDIAVVHDEINKKFGGAYSVAYELARTFDAPLYVRSFDSEVVPDDLDVEELTFGGVSRWINGTRAYHKIYKSLYYRSPDSLTEYDIIVISDPLMAGWYLPKNSQTVIWYVHQLSPARNTRFHERVDGVIKRLYQECWRIWFDTNLSFPDVIVANSEYVAKQINRYWDKSADRVIYPPVDVRSFGPEYTSNIKVETPYYLVLSRLSRRKRVNEIIKSFAGTDKQLLIAGSGDQASELKSISDENITFLGEVVGDNKRALLAGAKALMINGQNEGFGITTVEAWASGTPVLGVRDGYTQFLIIDGQNGYLFDRGGENLQRALRTFEKEGVSWDASELQEFAIRFGLSRFQEEFRETVNEAIKNSQIQVPWKCTTSEQ